MDYTIHICRSNPEKPKGTYLTMQITFLGTSHGVPQADRFCSSTLLTVDGEQYLVDGGAPVADCLMRQGVDPSSVRAFFVTHMHTDHVSGAIPFLSLCNWYFKTAKPEIFLPEQRGVDLIRDYLRFTDGNLDEDRLRFRFYDRTLDYDDGHLRVSAIPNDHLAKDHRPSYSFVLCAGGKKAMFTGDLTASLSDFPEVLLREDFDLLVIENAHSQPADLLDKLNAARVRRVVITHVNNNEIKMPVLQAAVGTTPYELILAKDGMTLTV